MKVFIICKEPFPNGMAATNRIKCYAKAILSRGISCKVLIFSRNETGPVRINPESSGVSEGIPFKYSGGSTRKPRFKIPRKASEFYDRFMLRQYLKKNLQEGDVVLAYVNSDIDYMCSIIDTAHSKGAKYVRELCEIPFFGSQKEEDKAGLEEILNRLFPKCDGFITIADTLTDLARNNKRPDAKIIKIPILVDSGVIGQSVATSRTETPYIFHAGSLFEQKDGISGMLKAFGKARARLDFPTKIILTGVLESSPDKVSIEKTICDFDLKGCVEFVGYCTDEQTQKYLAGSSFTIINKYDNIQNNYCFSTKLATYLSAGKAVILTDVGEAMNWLENGKTAWIIPRDNTEALSEAIIYAFTHPDECQRIGKNGISLCRKCFDWANVAEPLENFFFSLRT